MLCLGTNKQVSTYTNPSTAASNHLSVSAFGSSQIQAQPFVANTTTVNVLSGSFAAGSITSATDASGGNSEATVTLATTLSLKLCHAQAHSSYHHRFVHLCC